MVNREVQSYLRELVVNANPDIAEILEITPTIKLEEMSFNQIMIGLPDKRKWKEVLTYLLMRFSNDKQTRDRFKKEAEEYSRQ